MSATTITDWIHFLFWEHKFAPMITQIVTVYWKPVRIRQNVWFCICGTC